MKAGPLSSWLLWAHPGPPLLPSPASLLTLLPAPPPTALEVFISPGKAVSWPHLCLLFFSGTDAKCLLRVVYTHCLIFWCSHSSAYVIGSKPKDAQFLYITNTVFANNLHLSTHLLYLKLLLFFRFVYFYEHGCFACTDVCAPQVCPVPPDVRRGCRFPLEYGAIGYMELMSHH